LPWTQLAPQPSTTPRGTELLEFQVPKDPPSPNPLVRLSDEVQVLKAEGEVIVACGHLKLEIAPLLTFESRSPDRCWTILAPAAARLSPRRTLAAEHVAENLAEVSFRYTGDTEHLLRVRARGERSPSNVLICSINSCTRLDTPVYSHLNTFSAITIRGHRKLALSFSPCNEAHIDVLPADYPVGRPARFAYLDSGLFRVVEASSGEKGPFRTLGCGPIDTSRWLLVTLWDEDQQVGSIRFDDWTSQASTDLSPTAGWGVPVNAIEFSRMGNGLDSPVQIWLTLAGTSVGRGWHSVGHAAGTYVNQMSVEEARH
jgi:hypothetical protein